jgi:alpha-ketoglutarate-dependent taurine dioxygenase
MPEILEQPPPLEHPPHLSVRYETNPDGWVTAQFVELPEVISQGRDRDEAWVNLLDALHDLAHEPTRAEQIARNIQARVIEPVLTFVHRRRA